MPSAAPELTSPDEGDGDALCAALRCAQAATRRVKRAMGAAPLMRRRALRKRCLALCRQRGFAASSACRKPGPGAGKGRRVCAREGA